ncbi:MAG: Vir protein [Duncaniella sp.]|uniref:Vir protein n=1 Tax=Duncaniella sp. TaxID=2518496 RepID=UPI0023C63F6A|nr:Vir protein [Duncaniella sp.]MDE5988969.1 Vir protein [Duncaniella sp.]
MASNEQSVTLLRMNKRAQVEALNTLGFNLTEGARASQFPDLVRWAAGLLDVTLAANRKRDNRKFFFTLAEWQSLTSTEQDLFLLRGVRVRAWGQSFVIAPDNITNKTWGRQGAVQDAHSFSAKKDLYKFFNAFEETRNIATVLEGQSYNGIVGAPAAEAALAYKVFTLERDGLEDDSEWCLPTLAHLVIMFRFRVEIEEIITAVWSADFKFLAKAYWSCCSWDNSSAYRLQFESGSASADSKTNSYNVRPISLN